MFMERQLKSVHSKIVRHVIRLTIFLLVGVLASILTGQLGGRLDTQIMIGAAFVATLGGGYVFKYY